MCGGRGCTRGFEERRVAGGFMSKLVRLPWLDGTSGLSEHRLEMSLDGAYAFIDIPSVVYRSCQ